MSRAGEMGRLEHSGTECRSKVILNGIQSHHLYENGREMMWFGNIPQTRCRNQIFSSEKKGLQGEVMDVCKYLKSCHMEGRLRLVFSSLKGRTRINVGNHRKANFCSTKRRSLTAGTCGTGCPGGATDSFKAGMTI